jgi:4-amino-4-deoxy-L-arabinose transferase-like glycosyltransferase
LFVILKLKQHQTLLWHGLVCGIVLLSFFLRVYQLNNIAVDKGEQMSISWFIREGLPYLLTHNKDLNNHPLNSVLAYFTSYGNESIFTLRWHSAVIGVIGVTAILRLAHLLFGRRDGLVAGLLAATSAYYVAFSQISRGYAGLVAFTALGFYFTYRAVRTGQKRYWLAFVLISVLNIYNHLYGAMAVGAVALATVVLIFRAPERQESTRRAVVEALAPLAVSLALIYPLAFALYLPMLTDTVSIVGQPNQFRASDVRQAEASSWSDRLIQPLHEAIRPFSLADDSTRLQLVDPTIYYTPLDPIAALAEDEFGYYLSLLSFGLGLLFSWRKFRWQTLALLAWLALPFLAPLLGGWALPGSYFRGRFVGFIYVPYLLLMARGWPELGAGLARLTRQPLGKLLSKSIGWLGVGALLLLNLAWLSAFYTAASQEHWPAIARHIGPQLQQHDVVLCGQRLKTACDADLSTRMRADVKNFDELITFEQVRAKRSFVEQPGRVWLVLPHLLPWQTDHLAEKMEPTHYWLLGDPAHGQAGWLLIDSQPTLGDNLAAGLQLLTDLALNSQDKFRSTLSLAQLQLAREHLPEAEIAFAAASALASEQPEPSRTFAATAEQLQYARQAARPIENLPPAAVSVHLNFAGQIRLVAYEIEPQIVSPGQFLQVKLYWQALTRIRQNLVSYVHLTDRQATLIGQASGVPAAGKSPTPAWSPDQIIVDSYTIKVDDMLQGPLIAHVEAGLYEPQTFTFIQPLGETGQSVSSALTDLKIAPAVWPAPQPAHPLQANFDGLIRLAGYDLQADPPGVVLYWQAQAPITEDYTVFIHLLDASGQVIGQMDGPPLQGNYPTSWWLPHEVIVDRRAGVEVNPANIRQLLVGWYRPADGSRLPLVDGSGDSVSLDFVQMP